MPTQYSKEQGWIYSEDAHPLALVRVGVHGFGRVFFKQKCNIGPLEEGGGLFHHPGNSIFQTFSQR